MSPRVERGLYFISLMTAFLVALVLVWTLAAIQAVGRTAIGRRRGRGRRLP